MSTKSKAALAKKDTWEPEWLQRMHAPSWVVAILAIIFILRIPSFFEPYYYGDEMIYLNLGEAIKRGMVLYRDIHDNKPPLLYFMAAVAGNVFWFRAILALWMMITTVFFWKLANALFPKKQLIIKGAVAAFATLTTIPLLEGQIANAELFMIGPTIVAFYILLSKKLTVRNLLVAGVLLSLSTLFKVPSIFDIGAIVFIWLVTLKPKKAEASRFIRQSIYLFVGFIIPILFTFLWYSLQGAFNEYFVAAFLQNVGYVSTWRPSDVSEPFLVKNAPLLLRGAIMLLGLGVLFAFRKKLSGPFLFATAWLLFSLFAATLSERPYPHYLIQVVPSLSLLIGVLLASQSIEQSLSIIPIFLVPLTAIYFQFWHYPSASYYQKFLSFISGQTTKEEYFMSFDKNAPRNYKIAQYLLASSNEDEKIFVWGDSPTIYALTKRLPPIKYVATYHINDFSSQEETIESLIQNNPKFVIVLPESDDFPHLESFLQSEYLLIEDIQGAKIWKAVGFSVNSLLK